MGSATLLLAALILTIGQISPTERPALSALAPDLQRLLIQWQHQDCSIGTDELVEQMKSTGATLEEALWEAYDLGPSLEEREAFQSSLRDWWLLRHHWLEAHGHEIIGQERTQELLAESEEQFRIEEDVKQVSRWRDAAISGLGLVCTERSVARMEAIAKDPQSSSSSAARAALARSAKCSSLDNEKESP